MVILEPSAGRGPAVPAWIPDGGLINFDFYVFAMRVAISRPCPVGPLPISSRAPEDSGGDMSGHRLSRLQVPSPRGRPYVLNSVCKGISYFFNTQKKFQEIFDFVDTQRVAKGDFSGFSVVKRFNSIYYILYIRYPAGVPYLAPYLIRAGQVSGPEHRTDTRSKAVLY